MNIIWIPDNRIQLTEPLTYAKKITGTRFAAILGANKYSTPFQIWCEMTKVYEPVFTENKYTLAGKAIEPKLIQYFSELHSEYKIETPTDRYGQDYFSKTWGDFFPQEQIYGGMWDALGYDKIRPYLPSLVIECKTTGKRYDWYDSVTGEKTIPQHYALQAALYAFLLGIRKVVMPVAFLSSKDYKTPENFKCSSKNTDIFEFDRAELFPDMTARLDYCDAWYSRHISTGISPEYDRIKDAEYLDGIAEKYRS